MGVAGPLAVVPNGVDLDYFRAGAELATAPRLAFVGTLDYDPCERGLWYFCNEILPKIRAKLPGATFTAIGRNPSRRLLDLAGPERGIEFTGRVEDLRPHVQAARVFVVPLLSGSGTRLKILEAMAMGVPVVSTTIGAEGIDGVDGEHFRIADAPEAFAQAVLELSAIRSSPRACARARASWWSVRSAGRKPAGACWRPILETSQGAARCRNQSDSKFRAARPRLRRQCAESRRHRTAGRGHESRLRARVRPAGDLPR